MPSLIHAKLSSEKAKTKKIGTNTCEPDQWAKMGVKQHKAQKSEAIGVTIMLPFSDHPTDKIGYKKRDRSREREARVAFVMYSTSTGKKLSQLPDLDAHHSVPQEPLKRKPRQIKGLHTTDLSPFCKCNDRMKGHTRPPSICMDLSVPNSTPLTPPPSSTPVIPVTAVHRKLKSGGRGKKPPHELLSEAQKKANHIASEQKRRHNIRVGFDQLTDIVPTLSHCHRSESLILQKCKSMRASFCRLSYLFAVYIAYDYIQQLLDNKTMMKDRIRELQMILGDA